MNQAYNTNALKNILRPSESFAEGSFARFHPKGSLIFFRMSTHFITGILAGFAALASLFLLCQMCYRMGYNDARQIILKGQNSAINEVLVRKLCWFKFSIFIYNCWGLQVILESLETQFQGTLYLFIYKSPHSLPTSSLSLLQR